LFAEIADNIMNCAPRDTVAEQQNRAAVLSLTDNRG
jgi:hypothetical protein